MDVRDFICIGCPLGCPLTVSVDGERIEVKGHTCPRGVTYAKKEVLSPTRIVTSSVRVDHGTLPLVSVKTERDVPKEKIMDIMKEIRKARVCAPVKIGDVIIENCGESEVAVIATKNIEKCL